MEGEVEVKSIDRVGFLVNGIATMFTFIFISILVNL